MLLVNAISAEGMGRLSHFGRRRRDVSAGSGVFDDEERMGKSCIVKLGNDVSRQHAGSNFEAALAP